MKTLSQENLSSRETLPISVKCHHYNNINSNSNVGDDIINLLKKKVGDLEQKQELSNQITQRYKQLQTDYELLSEEKIALHYNNKTNKETLNNQILELRAENEALQLSLHEKLITNKQLLQEKSDQIPLMQQKSAENIELMKERDDVVTQLDKLKKEQAVFINLFKEQEVSITLLKAENERLNEEMNFLKNSLGMYIDKVQLTKESDTKIKGRLIGNKKIMSMMKSKIDDLKIENSCTQTELNIFKIKLDNEKEFRKDREQEVTHLNTLIKDLDKELGEYKVKHSSNIKEINALRNQVIEVNRQNNHLIGLVESIKRSDGLYQYNNNNNSIKQLIPSFNGMVTNRSYHNQPTYNNINTQMSTKATCDFDNSCMGNNNTKRSYYSNETNSNDYTDDHHINQ